MNRRATPTIAALIVLLVIAVVGRILATRGGFEWPDDPIIWELRTLRIAAAMIIGAALATAGVLLQSILRNPLASPFILGLTSGAGLGIVVATYIAFLATGTIVTYAPPLHAAIIGAFAALALVYVLSQRRGLIEPTTLILVGVIVSILCGSLTTLFQSLMPDRGLAVYSRWVMGSISEETPWNRLTLVGCITLAGIAASAWLGPALDAASLSDDEARSVGVPLGPLRLVCFAIAGVLTSATIVLAGPIGFVGLICPHMVRALLGPSHRALVIGSALAGALLLVVADTAVTLPTLQSGRVPIGVLTSLIGGPVFIVLLRRARSR